MPGFLRLLILLLFSAPLHAADLILASGTGQKILMELYTSEGCSSCPPMERYLNGFRSRAGLWDVYIPVAFHVDYWNDLGWEDRFASPDYARRQREHAREGHVRSVYTPALIVNGNGWRPGLFSQTPEPGKDLTGNLEVTVKQNTLSADYRPLADDTAAFDLHIALLGMGLQSRITAGENKGRTAQHDFVVIGFKALPGQGGRWRTRLPKPHYRNTEPRALAVWVTRSGSLKPLQAVGGYLH